MIKFIDLQSQQKIIRNKLETRIKKVLDHGQFIQGPEIQELQERLSKLAHAKYVLCCSSGTDALLLSLLGLGFKPREGVIVPSFTFASSAEVVPLLGGVPIFADVDKSSFNICPDSIIKSIETAKKNKIKVKGIMTVGLFGQPSNMSSIKNIAKYEKLWILDDAAQSFGAQYKKTPVGSLAEVTATSFFPSKPLGGYGDSGALFTNKKSVYDIAYSSHLHGMGKNRYEYERLGINGRIDTIQATILIEKLNIFNKELIKRELVAKEYKKNFADLNTNIQLPAIIPGATSTWAQFTIILPEKINRDLFQKKLSSKNIPTAIYYAKPLHKQKPYKFYPISIDKLKNTEYLSKNVISLPMHPYLSKKEISYICENVHNIINKTK